MRGRCKRPLPGDTGGAAASYNPIPDLPNDEADNRAVPAGPCTEWHGRESDTLDRLVQPCAVEAGGACGVGEEKGNAGGKRPAPRGGEVGGPGPANCPRPVFPFPSDR